MELCLKWDLERYEQELFVPNRIMTGPQLHKVEVVGSGPNGLAAAIRLARAGVRVVVFEGEDTPGGGTRTQELTLPGFRHDACAAVTPLALASPFFSSLLLERHGLRWIQPQIPLAHPMDRSKTVFLYKDLMATASGLKQDGSAYFRTFNKLVQEWPELLPDLLAPLHFPSSPMPYMRFGLQAVLPAEWLARCRFKGKRAQALFAGLAAHSMLPLNRPLSSAFGLVLGASGHSVGWPIVAGGTQRLAEALVSELRALGGEVRTGQWITDLDLDSDSQLTMLDLSPKSLLKLTGNQLPERYRSALEAYRYGPGVFKVDWALDGPVPWTDPECLRAGTLHLGGTLDEIVRSEAEVWQGEHPNRPFVILVQPSLFDRGRAPPGKHTTWAYCHVPHGSERSMTERVEAQVERFAPGFKNRILARSTMNARDMETYNPNYVGGDVNVGVQDLRGHFLRPVSTIDPYRTPIDGLFICSSATPPGGGVHGMCGYHAAESSLRWRERRL